MGRLLVRPHIIASVVALFVLLAPVRVTAQMSTLDTHRATAASLFTVRFGALSLMRTELAADWKTYERACRGKATTGRGVGVVFLRTELAWFVQSLELDNETMPACRMLATAMSTRSQHVAREVQQIDEDARRRGIYPGIMRDLKRSYGFE